MPVVVVLIQDARCAFYCKVLILGDLPQQHTLMSLAGCQRVPFRDEDVRWVRGTYLLARRWSSILLHIGNSAQHVLSPPSGCGVLLQFRTCGRIIQGVCVSILAPNSQERVLELKTSRIGCHVRQPDLHHDDVGFSVSPQESKELLPPSLSAAMHPLPHVLAGCFSSICKKPMRSTYKLHVCSSRRRKRYLTETEQYRNSL